MIIYMVTNPLFADVAVFSVINWVFLSSTGRHFIVNRMPFYRQLDIFLLALRDGQLAI